MQNKAVEIKRKYEKKLINAIQKAGGVSLKNKGVNIDFISLVKPKELFAVDNIEIISIDEILQEVSSGKVMIHNREFGLMSFDFDFAGSLEECSHYIDELGSNEITFDELIKDATPEMIKLLIKRATPSTMDNLVSKLKQEKQEPIFKKDDKFEPDAIMFHLAKVVELDLGVGADYAYSLVEDSFYNLYPRGGSVETYAVLEQAYQQNEHNKSNFTRKEDER